MSNVIPFPPETIVSLIGRAMEARRFSYSPYSHFQVGAALLTDQGIYTGCNIENAAYSPGNCAERTAIFKAVSEGVRHFQAIAIIGGSGDSINSYAYPCGVCRQVMMEFCDPEHFYIITARSPEDYRIALLSELFPCGFGPENLKTD